MKALLEKLCVYEQDWREKQGQKMVAWHEAVKHVFLPGYAARSVLTAVAAAVRGTYPTW